MALSGGGIFCAERTCKIGLLRYNHDTWERSLLSEVVDQLDPYADPYGDSTGWTRQFEVDCDLRVFLGKVLKVVVLQRKMPILAAHNPEVVWCS